MDARSIWMSLTRTALMRTALMSTSDCDSGAQLAPGPTRPVRWTRARARWPPLEPLRRRLRVAGRRALEVSAFLGPFLLASLRPRRPPIAARRGCVCHCAQRERPTIPADRESESGARQPAIGYNTTYVADGRVRAVMPPGWVAPAKAGPRGARG
jgi:hypothetical protein